MEIKSILLNDDDFRLTKESIIMASEEDHKESWRVKMIEYINNKASSSQDQFFYDMLPSALFLKPDNQTTAYTTPDTLIYMNAPGIMGENIKHWDFIYCHECLHQLWDTFKVGEKIKNSSDIEYDHYVLNIASDCIINDYLYTMRGKERPDDLITPEYLEKEFNVQYDRKIDTQFTLYKKLIEVKNQLHKDQRCQDQCGDDQQQGQGQGQGQGKQQQGQGQGQKGDKKDQQQGQGQGQGQEQKGDKKDQQQGQGQGQGQNGDKKDQQQGQGQGQGQEQKGDKKDQQQGQGQGQGQQGNKKGQQQGQGGQSQGQQQSQGDQGDNSNDQGGGGNQAGFGNGELNISEADLKNIRERNKEIIERYSKKIAGDFGDFLKKCRSSQDLDNNGLSVGAKKASKGWNEKMESEAITYVKSRVNQMKRQYQKTYKRIKRGSGYVPTGGIIIPGKRVRDEKMNINPVFYVDKSGSMGDSIDNVWKATFTICESLKEEFGRESLIDKIEFKTYAFDMQMHEIKFGHRCSASGGTMPFDEILEFISKNTKECLLNIIITDAGFDVNEEKVDKLIHEIEGMLFFITNIESSAMKNLAKKYPNQLYYHLASADFSLT